MSICFYYTETREAEVLKTLFSALVRRDLIVEIGLADMGSYDGKTRLVQMSIITDLRERHLILSTDPGNASGSM
jgi:hypothetical protein